jgi:hypothetical protein
MDGFIFEDGLIEAGDDLAPIKRGYSTINFYPVKLLKAIQALH